MGETRKGSVPSMDDAIILDELPLGVAVVEEDGTLLYHNVRMTRLLHASGEHLSGKNIFDFPVMKNAKEGITLNELKSGEKRIEVSEHLGGSRKGDIFVLSIKPFKESHLIITVQKQKEGEELNKIIRESRDRFKTIVDTIEDGIVAFDSSMKIILCNFPFSTGYGKEPREVVGKNLDEILSPEEFGAERNYIFEVLKSGEVVHTRLTRKVGSRTRHYFTRYIPRISPGGGVDSVLRIAADQTQRIEAEREFIRAKEYIDNLISSSTDVIYSTNLEGNITVWNRAAEEVYGRDEEEAISSFVEDIIEKKWGDYSFPEVFEKVQVDGKMVIDVERARGGKSSSSLCTISPVLDPRDGVVAISFIEKDISDIKRLHEELKEKNRELEGLIVDLRERESQLIQSEKMASIGQLAAGMAHEINNPTGFIKSNLQTFSEYARDLGTFVAEILQRLDGGKMDGSLSKMAEDLNISFILEDLKNVVSESMEGVQRIQHIVQNVKTFAHKGELEKERVDLTNVLEGAITLAWNEIKYKARVEREYEPGIELECFPIQLGQVVLNMLVNAAQAIEGKEGEIRVSTSREGDNVVVTVSDNGKGMPEEVKKRIFEPFYTTKPVGKGTGLGLSIAYDIIVEKHGGKIDFASEDGKGSTFTMELPLTNGGR
jgi:PAS domain S-box-containing protein